MSEGEHYTALAVPGDHDRITEIHQQAFVSGCMSAGRELDVDEERLWNFVNGEFAVRRRAAWKEAIENRQGVYTERDRDRIVGFGQIVPDATGNKGFISALYVDTGKQGRGVGTALLYTMLRKAQRRQYTSVNLIVTRGTRAVDFYLSRGFTITDLEAPTPEPPKAYGLILGQIAMEFSLAPLKNMSAAT